MGTTVLIGIPLVGALVLWLLPWRSTLASGFTAGLFAAADVAWWVGTALNFDFGFRDPQFDLNAVWFRDLGVAYHVGLYDFSLWLTGLTVIVTLAAVAYGVWYGLDRALGRSFGGQLVSVGAALLLGAARLRGHGLRARAATN